MIEIEGKQVYTELAELVDPAHSALLVVDMQRDCCEAGGAFDELGIDLSMYPPVIVVGARVALRQHVAGVVHDQAVRHDQMRGAADPRPFFATAKAHLDRLRNDGDDVSRMMSIGLHPRITGNPARSDAMARFVDDAQSLGDVWFARRIDIATTFVEQQPSDRWLQ